MLIYEWDISNLIMHVWLLRGEGLVQTHRELMTAACISDEEHVNVFANRTGLIYNYKILESTTNEGQ